jgi:TonB family protein
MIALPFLILSAAIHLILGFGVSQLPPPGQPVNPQAIEVTVVDKNPSERRQTVRQALIPPSMLVSPSKDRARFQSEKEQWVKREMRSKNVGLTVNGNTDRSVAKNDSKSGKPQTKTKTESDDETGDLPRVPSKTLSDLGQDLLVTSRNSDELPDIAEGPITALNSERFIYYSFFSRVQDRIYPLWTRAFQDVLDRMPMSEQNRTVGKIWRTEVEIIIDSEGRFEKALVMRSSGLDSLDQAPVRAFREAAFFPNPPSGMVQADGKVHLKWGFTHVVDDGRAWARRSSP